MHVRIVGTLYYEHELEHLKASGAGVILVHTSSYTRNTTHSFSIEEIKTISKKAKVLNLEVYLLINIIIHEEHLAGLHHFFNELKNESIDGIVAFDFSIYPILKAYQLEKKMIYQPGTLTTNYYDPLFCKENGIKGLTLSKEITLQNMLETMILTEDIEYSLVGHGYLELFYSRRPLVKNYLKFKNIKQIEYLRKTSFYLKEELRPLENYPIIEDEFGTTIFRSSQLQSFKEIDVLKPYITDFFIERIFLDDTHYFDALEAYQNPQLQQEFIKKYPKFDSGFYYRSISSVKEESE